MAMDNPDLVVGRSTHFHKSDAHIDDQFLLYVFHRLQNKKGVSESVVVTDANGKVILKKNLDPDIYSPE
jgi:hypothetical protein